MADTFHEIEKGHEAKFKLDEELKFKAQSRCNRLLGLWAAERMGQGQQGAAVYARELVLLDLDEPGIGNVIRRIRADFETCGVALTLDEIMHAASRFYASALEQIASDYPMPLGPDHEQVGG